MILDNFFININRTFGNPYIVFVLFLIVGISTYTDIKHFKIYNKYVLLLLFFRILLAFIPTANYPFTLEHLVGAFTGVIILWIPAVHFMWKMGGDFKLIFVLGLFLGLEAMFVFLGLSFFYCVFYSLIKKSLNKSLKLMEIKIPFCIGFLLSLITLFVISCFI